VRTEGEGPKESSCADIRGRFKVLDDVSFQKDPLLGWACYRLDRLRQGLVLLHLRGEDSKLTGGKVLVEMHAKWDADTTTY
jgi:hypothetical protein